MIVNANVKANEAQLAFTLGASLLRPGGTVVLVDFCPGGQVLHQYSGPAGYLIGGPGYHGRRTIPAIGRAILCTPNPDYTSLLNFGEPENIEVAESWCEVLAKLSDLGPGTRAAVIADGTITGYPKL